MPGVIDVLNCNRGHLSVSFSKDDPLESERAKRIIEDMLRRGYALFIEDDDKKLHKVKKFDAKRCEYIIADGPLYAGETIEPEPQSSSSAGKAKKDLPKLTERRVSAHKARATGIAPTAGG